MLLGLVIILWQQVSRAAFGNEMIQKLPSDSYLAGVAKLSRFDYHALNQASASAKLEQAEVAPLIELLNRDKVTIEQLRTAFGDQIAFAKSKRGNVLVLTIKDEAAFSKLTDQVRQEATDTKTVDQLPKSGQSVKVWQGMLHNPDRLVAAYRSGGNFYVGSTADIVASVSQETDGFTSQEFFTDVSKQLPPGQDAYLFLNPSQSPQPPVVIPPLTGVGILNQKDSLKVSTFTADTPAATGTLSQTDGALLPDPARAPGAIQGKDVLAYFQLLQDQRQESDLPKVIRFQNGLAQVNRKLGINLQSDFFGKANGTFVYARYRTPEGKDEWFGAIEFDSNGQAASAVNDLTKRLRERVTVPVRRETLRTLADGTQSREIVSEGSEALEIGDISVEGRAGNQAVFPSIGNVSWAVDGKYLVLGSSAEAAARMVQTIARPTTKIDTHGDLAVQLKLSELPALTATKDGLFDWILSTQAESGSFTLNKQSGELRGVLRFNTDGS